MNDDADEHRFKGVLEAGGMGERNDDAAHEEIDGDAVKDAGDDGFLGEKAEAAAGEEEDGGGAESDDEMQEQAEERGGYAAIVSLGSENSGGDSLYFRPRVASLNCA